MSPFHDWLDELRHRLIHANDPIGGVTDHGALTGLADDDHPQYATDTDLTTHVGAADPHTGYLKESIISGMAAPTIALGATAAAGVATTTIASDATIDAFDTTVPNIIEPDDAAAVGIINFAARRDHEHGIVTAVAGASTFADAAAEGTATSFARSDHKHSREADPVTAHVAAGNPHSVYATDADLAAHATGTHEDTGWQTPTLLNSWAIDGDANYGIVSMYRRINGIVYLRGILNPAGASADTIFVLPSGYRPSNIHLAIGTHGDGGAHYIEVQTNGNVMCPTRGAWLSLSGVSFPVG